MNHKPHSRGFFSVNFDKFKSFNSQLINLSLFLIFKQFTAKINKISIILLGLTLIGAKAQENTPPPNIVIILADDLGYECINSYGGTSYNTPHLTQLAQTGMQFENCHAQPICTPSRVKLMTGRSNKKNHVKFGFLNPKEKAFS